MYLAEVNLWNFRKYSIDGESFEKSKPGVSIPFNEGLNVLIGENDSGKTTIVDAIRYALGTQSGEWTRIEEADFHAEGEKRAQELKIECVFRGFSDQEAGSFLEWLGTENIDGTRRFVLRVRLTARMKEDRIISDIRAGADLIGVALDGDARALLRVTYLKPLRDADAELTPGRRSRFAHILRAHSLFQKTDDQRHELETILAQANEAIEDYFHEKNDGSGATTLMKALNSYIEAFFAENESYTPAVRISGGELFEILQRLSLTLDVNPAGLGAANLLFMATELLLLQSEENYGARLALIEELEAHLHPQAQLRLIRYLEEKSTRGQFILTTHSTTMGSSIPLRALLICKGDKVFAMGSQFTKLQPRNYDFLFRFLDATKANLFFARGVLLVEGDAENLLLPTLAKVIKRPLHRYGVSIVNVGSTAFAHFVKIFHRQDGTRTGIKVALVTDMDVKPTEWENTRGETLTQEDINAAKACRMRSLADLENEEIKVFVSPNWTLEYELGLSPFQKEFYRSLLWAEKIANSGSGVPQDSKQEDVDARVVEDFRRWCRNWSEDDRLKEKIAFEIYYRTMVEKGISKAITAQVFAEHLENRLSGHEADALRSELRGAATLQYLLDAIYHVTEPCEVSDAD